MDDTYKEAADVESVVSSALTGDEPRDRSIEAWIESFGATWVIRELAVDVFDVKRSRHNQARTGTQPITEMHVARLVEAYKQGAQFPPLVAHQTRDGLVMINGNHRHEAYLRLGVHRCWVYEVTADADVIDAMKYAANAELSSLPLTEEATITHALQLTRQGVSHETVARRVGRTSSWVGRIVRLERARRRVDDLGVERAARKVSDKRLLRLNSVRADAPFKRAVAWAAENDRASDEQLERVVKVAREHEGDDTRALVAVGVEIEEMEREAKQRKVAGRKPQPKPSTVEFALMRLEAVSKIDVAATLRDLEAAPEHEPRMRLLLERAAQKMNEMCAALQAEG